MKWVLCLLCVVGTSSCASTAWKPLNRDALKSSAARSITIALSAPAIFVVQGPNRHVNGAAWVAGGFIGGGVAALADAHAERQAGRKVVDEYHLADPGPSIRTRLLDALSKAYGLEVRAPPVDQPVHDDQPAWGADLVLEAYTSDWGMVFVPGQTLLYRVKYQAQVSLFDTRNGRDIARGSCNNLPPAPPEDEVTVDLSGDGYESLLDKDAALLKAALAKAGETCLAKFASELLAVVERRTAAPTTQLGSPAWPDAGPTEGRK